MFPPNITSQKVAIPSILFLALSPGMLLKTNGMKLNFKSVSTDASSVFFHGLVFFLAYSTIAKCMGLILTQNDLLVTTSLFMALSPGMLLTIPPGQVMSGKTSQSAILVHTIVYALVFAILRKQFPKFY
jgi:hypothetical protein|tara:strand:+ start:101 stop:487 length:387 start_codon:yes stop_codon:yes gene_type:complete